MQHPVFGAQIKDENIKKLKIPFTPAPVAS